MAIHPAARCRSEPAIRMVKVTFRENPCIDMEEDVMEQQIMQPQTNAGAAQEQRHPIAIEAIDLVKDYGHGENAVHALRGVNVRFEQGRFTAIMGPSGSGKSTLMHTLAGLDSATSGHIVFDGADITTMNDNQLTMLRRHKIGFIFQSFNLLPMFTAEQNILMPLTLAGQKPDRQWFDMLTTTLGLKERLTHRPNELSGGQQQRVAIARALVSRPRVLLLDEPLAALDLKLRKDMQQELKNIQKATGITFVFVTHDQEEALSMSDTIVVMSEGRIQQIGTPIDIYNEPENAFVADFIGESNIVDGIMRKDFSVTFSGHTFTCVDKGFAKNENVDVVIRPEDVDIVPIEQGMLRGTVTSITFMGVHYEIIIDINGFKWMIQTTDYVDEGAEVGLYIEPDAIHIMKKSEYSGMYGDYSSFSNELDELSDAESEPDE